MNTNLLIALKNIVDKPVTNLVSHYSSSNRMNNMGEALELYVKDIFCNSLEIETLAQKNEIFAKYFSYIGNQNNPPDLMIKDGDAIEVKKIESLNSGIALNSSYPKNKLYSDSSMITKACRECEEWTEKDLLYVVGVTKNDVLKSLWFVYGDCYAASSEIYERIRTKISSGLRELADVEFAETNELGRVNRVDPLGITYLRIRGMWHIENPNKVFDYVTETNAADFTVNALVLKNKYDSFPVEDRKAIEAIKLACFSIKDVSIKSPDNPAKLLDAKLISFRCNV
jgi:hypothetical protein